MVNNQFRFFCTDLDGTLLGNDQFSSKFKQVWENIPEERRPLLCYTSGRLLDDILHLIQSKILPEPDYIVAAVGTSIYDFGQQKIIRQFTELLDEGWNLAQVNTIASSLSVNLEKQPEHFQNEYKSSWYLNNAPDEQIDQIRESFEEADDLQVRVVYSSSRHLDILPNSANKGNSLKWLLKHLGISTSETIVAGDSGNDSAMFTIRGIRGIVTGNAQPELLDKTATLDVYRAPQSEVCAQAVINGLRHYGIVLMEDLPSTDPQDPVHLERVVLVSS
ncbi:MAG: HAD-IIB family hydrolase, partial [Saprospiraceae bacterium]|nr:HAD-IIB family hydrolase [Saprospiraceae bacterium]